MDLRDFLYELKLNKVTFPDNKEKKTFFPTFYGTKFFKKTESFPIRRKKILQLNRNFTV